MTIRDSIRSFGSAAAPVATASAPRSASRRVWRAPLAAKLAAALIGLVILVLLVNGAINTWLNYNQARRAALEVQEEKARSAAVRVGEFLAEIETQLGWTTGAEWRRTQPDQQRYDFVRLLRQAPAITELSYLDGQGKEQIKVSRLEPDSIGSGRDFSKDPRFVEAVADKIWFGPVEFRRGSEPYMTIALAHVGREPGVTVADVNLKLIWDVVSAIRVGEKGYAYVVDDKGRLIAHPDLSLVLRDTDFAHLPQVKQALDSQVPAEPRAPAMAAPRVGMAEIATAFDGNSVLTAYAVAPRTNWIVFVQQPVAEALASVYRSLLQTLALLGLGLLLALIVGGLLARRMVVPIRRLQQGAEKLGAGDLSQRLDIHTGDEIETLADRFNQMAGRIQESYETLEAKVEARTQDLNQALHQQTATANVLKVISRSAFDLQAVFDTLIASAVELIGAGHGTIYVREGERFLPKAHSGITSEFKDFLARNLPTPGRGSVTGRVMLSGKVEAIPDLVDDSDYALPTNATNSTRSILAAPLLRNDRVEGVVVIGREDPGAFLPRQVELVQTFADQAVIAIENVRLFDEVQARTRDLSEALQQQTATADVLKVISRSAFDLQPVLDALVESAYKLCGAGMGLIYLRSGDAFECKAIAGGGATVVIEANTLFKGRPIRAGRGTAAERVIMTGEVHAVEDFFADPDFDPRVKAAIAAAPLGSALAAVRSTLAVPMKRDDDVVGVIVIARSQIGPFPTRQIELLRTFADQAVIAIENARLFDEVQAKTSDLSEALQQQTATADVLKVISRSVLDLDSVLQTLIDTAVRLARGSRGSIWIKEGDVLVAKAFHRNVSDELRQYLSAAPWPIDGDSHQVVAVREGRVVHIPDLSKVEDATTQEVRKRAAYGAGLWVPLIGEGQTIGVFGVPRDEAVAFTDREIEIVKTFADQAVIAIQNSHLFEQVRAKTRDLEESLQQQTATADVLKAISRTAFDLDTVLNTLVSTAVRLCGANHGEIFRRHGGVYRHAASTMDFASGYEQHERSVEIGPGRGTLIGRVALENRAVSIADAWSDPEYEEKDEARLGNIRAMLGAPLMRGGEPIGAFALGRSAPIPFTERQIELVTTFADQAVIAIENVRLFDEVQARTRDLTEALQQQTATADVLKVISRSAFDLQAVFDTLVSTAADLNDAYSGAICVRDGDVFRYRASRAHGAEDEVYRYLQDHPATPDRSTVVGRTILSGQVEQIPDILEDKDYAVPMASLGNPARALLGVPLLGKERVEGAIVLTRREPGLYPQRQIETLKTFADQAVIAIENARLFDQVQARTKELAQTVDDLRSAQDRLIQSEKLASLGQLTAGIAHEIKNPLNFVNNFAALSRELIEELKEVVATTKPDEKTKEEIDEITGMLEGNLAKVVQHGKRADSIVKNMLLHSRESSGDHRPVDLNAVVEESVNLAYHGARAEKPGFNVTLLRDFDPSVGEVDLYPQEFTRVLLNLISNGFYATTKRKTEGGETAFEPTLRASTKNFGDRVEIKIRDNGTGIPAEVKAKMFNPFFTTKPAGEGTGLGLSLSYDIIAKQHGGTIDVETKPGEFTEFTIVIPRGGPPSPKN